MQLLIIGGTRFLGRALVEAAAAAGHDITLFNRGQSNPGLYPHLEQIRGDRVEGLDALRGRHWDAVVDTCGFVPSAVGASARLLASTTDHYTFISTISVYADPPAPGMDEDAPLGTLADETVEEVNGETYGPLKALCERAVMKEMSGRGLLVRSGLIVGPYDPTDRFTYWPVRVSRGGEILAPGPPEYQTQFIDVRDLGNWVIHATEQRLTGAYNVTGPAQSLTLDRLLDACRAATSKESTITWVSEAFLLAQDVTPFTEMPLWVPSAYDGLNKVSIEKARSAGLSFRPLAETVRDTLAWASTRASDYVWRAGLTTEREVSLLERWHDERGQTWASV